VADLRYANMQHARSAIRRVLPPQRIDQAFRRDYVARVQQENTEKPAMSRTAHIKQGSPVGDLQGPEDPVFHLASPLRPG
jgi:hypothetical protein